MSKIELVWWQKDCLSFIRNERYVILSSPTGSGKTKVYENWAFEKNEKPIFITSPIKSLSNQRFRELTARGFKVGLETGDVHYLPDDELDIICCTQEIYNNKYRDVGNCTLIIDEFSYIFDEEERARVYIDSLKYSKANNILICSATFGNPGEVQEYIERVTGKDFCMYENEDRLTELEYRGAISINSIKNSLVVAFSMDDCYRIAKKIYDNRVNTLLGLAGRSKGYDPRKRFKAQILNLASKYDINNKELFEFATMGVVYYCGKLLPKEKLFIEDLFEKRFVDTVVGTDALALGVNFPVENVVFAQLKKKRFNSHFGNKANLISTNLFLQLSGRAGRKMYYDKGFVYYCEDFDKQKLGHLFEKLKRNPKEDFKIILKPSIRDILLGRTTIEEESKYIIEYSTDSKSYDDVFNEIEQEIEFIKKIDLATYYFRRKHGIDISKGFYDAISHLPDNKQKEFELISQRLLSIQVLFEQNISSVYMIEYSSKMNCDVFIDILLCVPLEKLIKNYCMSNKEFNLRNLLLLRKFMYGISTELISNYDLTELNNIINSLDFTVLNPEKLIAKDELKDDTKISSQSIPSNFLKVRIDNRDFVIIERENDRMLVCELLCYDGAYNSNLNLYYVSSNVNYLIIGKIDYDEMLNIWSKINFNSLGMSLDIVEGGMKSFNNFVGNYLRRTKK